MCIQFAIDAGNRLVHISEAERGLSCNSFCVVCGERMVAKKGQEREHHFSHESSKTACVVSHESLLHRFAKQVIQDAGGLVVPPHTGQSAIRWLQLERIEEEKRLQAIRPDLIGYEGNTPILIEVAYSSFVDAEKIAALAALQLRALEIDLRQFHPEVFDPEAAKQVVLNEASGKQWLYYPRLESLSVTRSCCEEIVTINGIWVALKDLPFGDLVIKVVAYNPEVNAIAKGIAKRYSGYWNAQYKNWIVPKRWRESAKKAVREAAENQNDKPPV